MGWKRAVIGLSGLVVLGMAALALLVVVGDSEEVRSDSLSESDLGLRPCDGQPIGDTLVGDLDSMLAGNRGRPPTEFVLANHDELVIITGALTLVENAAFLVVDSGRDACQAEVTTVTVSVTGSIRSEEFAIGDTVEVVLSSWGRDSLSAVLIGDSKIAVSLYRATTRGSDDLWAPRFEGSGVLAVQGIDLAAVESLKPHFASVADLRLVVEEGAVFGAPAQLFSIDEPPLDAVVEGDLDVPDDLVAGRLTPVVVDGLGGGSAWMVTCRQDAPAGASLSETCELGTIQQELSYLGPTTLPYRPPSAIQLSTGQYSCLEPPGCALAVALVQNVGVRATAPLEFAE